MIDRFLGVGVGLFAAAAAVAQDAPPAPVAKDDSINASLTLYLWAPSLNGESGVRGASIDIDAGFHDILDDTDHVFGLMGAFEITSDRLILQVHPTWMTMSADNQRTGALGNPISTELETNTLWVEFMSGYRFIDRPIGAAESGRRVRVDGIAGLRLTWLDMDVSLRSAGGVNLPDGTPLPAGVGVNVDESQGWVEPFFGARLGVDLTTSLTVQLRADLGGFGLGSDFAWQAIAMLGWRFDLCGADAALLVGYRALSQDYESGGFRWDVLVHGPVIGLNIAF